MESGKENANCFLGSRVYGLGNGKSNGNCNGDDGFGCVESKNVSQELQALID